MSLLRPSIAGRLLRAGGPSSLRAIPSTKRYDTTTAAGTKLTTSTPVHKSQTTDISEQGKGKKYLGSHNQPDYAAEVDQASSTFSPIPKRVMNGSEDTDVLPAAVLSGAPIELEARTVRFVYRSKRNFPANVPRIYKEAKTATQSGDWHGHHWRMDWDILSKGHRWENPLMGWQSSADFMQGTHISFKSKEDAIRFAEKQGYEYFVQEPNARKIAPKAYANNFLWSDKKLKHIRTK
ncbi:NADH-ubiquinone oxidoreductase 21 kDa [Hyphodiscus hymeniophilus]|uniref:NADH dehydrogenase [ubiquinone] iron-sulfur protein 4, mitochondrial n=1 Tax=Hyphodiscus hymeniophilus TaxID=353542 RepID=A0A9P7B090_9HELO|nr:NADH-ubiquinone oxidoreductase 21 kDa [Hyphodiscus hymeniophilus]